MHGYTLLEMVVVLTILGLVTAMAAPTLLRTIAAWDRQAQVDAVFDQVRALPVRARGNGSDIVVDDETLAGATPPIRVEQGWRLTTPTPWRVRANGVCQGGLLRLSDGRREWAIEAATPFCEPRMVEATGP